MFWLFREREQINELSGKPNPGIPVVFPRDTIFFEPHAPVLAEQSLPWSVYTTMLLTHTSTTESRVQPYNWWPCWNWDTCWSFYDNSYITCMPAVQCYQHIMNTETPWVQYNSFILSSLPLPCSLHLNYVRVSSISTTPVDVCRIEIR